MTYILYYINYRYEDRLVYLEPLSMFKQRALNDTKKYYAQKIITLKKWETALKIGQLIAEDKKCELSTLNPDKGHYNHSRP